MALSSSYMTVRLGILVAASIAVYTVNQFFIRTSRRSAPLNKPSVMLNPKNVQESSSNETEEDEKQLTFFDDGVITAKEKENDEKDEKEEVKLISGEITAPQSDLAIFDYEKFPELEKLLSGDVDFNNLKQVQSGEHKIGIEEKIYDKPHMDELEGLRNKVRELEEKEMKLEGELLEYYGLKEKESEILELQRQLKIKTSEINILNITINSLQSERKKILEEISKGDSAKKELEVARSKIKELQRHIQVEANQTKGQLLFLKQQVSGLQSKEEDAVRKDNQILKMSKVLKELELEVIELKRTSKELQHEKRELITSLSKTTESELVGNKMREELNSLKNLNEKLLKQVEDLRQNKFSEVEELVYLRWVNACLRFELRNYQTPSGKISAHDLKKIFSPKSQKKAKQLLSEYTGSDLDSNFSLSHPSSPCSEESEGSSVYSSLSGYSKKRMLIQKLKKWGGKSKDDSGLTNNQNLSSISTRSFSDLAANSSASSFSLISNSVESVLDENYASDRATEIKKKAEQARRAKLRDFLKEPQREESVISPPKINSQIKKKVVFFSVDREDDSNAVDSPVVRQMKSAPSEKTSRIVSAKVDVETEGDFIQSLATKVRAALFHEMEDLVVFVNWLDEKLSFLVDERAVLEHFDWPEEKVDALRLTAFEYQDLMKLENHVSGFTDDPNLSCEAELKKMFNLLEKVEQSVYAVLQTRNVTVSRYKEFGIPTYWLQDSGTVGKIKLSSVQLARKYINRVASELDTLEGPETEPNREFLVLQAVRFASRVHQFAGEFDEDSMKAFEELRSRIYTLTREDK